VGVVKLMVKSAQDGCNGEFCYTVKGGGLFNELHLSASFP